MCCVLNQQPRCQGQGQGQTWHFAVLTFETQKRFANGVRTNVMPRWRSVSRRVASALNIAGASPALIKATGEPTLTLLLNGCTYRYRDGLWLVTAAYQRGGRRAIASK